jgi:hypothetical protein
MSGPTFKVVNLRWWNRPVRLVKRGGEGHFDFVGWVWNQKAYLVKNLNHGWIAFVEDQTPENIEHWFCRNCGASIWGTMRSKIEAATKDLS